MAECGSFPKRREATITVKRLQCLSLVHAPVQYLIVIYLYLSGSSFPSASLASPPPSLYPSLLLVVRLARVPFFSARDSLALPVGRNSIQFLLPSVGGRFVGFDFFVILAVFSRINYVTTSWVIKRRTH